MNCFPMNILSSLFVLHMVCASSTALAITHAAPISAPDNRTNLFIQYENGLVEAEIINIPLGRLLKEFKEKAKLEFKFNHLPIANLSISATLRRAPLGEALKTVLEGFSYVVYHVDDHFGLIILYANIEDIKTHSIDATGSKQAVRAEKLTGIEDKNEQIANTDINSGPKTLDEFQPIQIAELTSDQPADGIENIDSHIHLNAEQTYKEAVLNRALDAISSQHKHLYEEAADQLVGIDDPRATDVLVDATTVENGRFSKLQAVETLSRHAVSLQYNNAASVEALQRLTEDSDESVSKLARETLSDMYNSVDSE